MKGAKGQVMNQLLFTDKMHNNNKSGECENIKKARPRRMISLETKMDIIKRCESGISLPCIARIYNMNRSTIATIIREKQKISEYYARKADSSLSVVITKQRNKVIERMERCLITWILDQQRGQQNLSVMMIKKKAISLFQDIKTHMQDTVDETVVFKASSGWFDRFKKRMNEEKFSSFESELDGVTDFPIVLAKFIAEEDYYSRLIFNVAETGLFWKSLPTQNFTAIEVENSPGLQVSKNRLTLLLGANASGDFKLKPLLVHYNENPTAFRGIDMNTLPVIWKSSKKGWITATVLQDWFVTYFVPAVEKYCKYSDLPFKVLLILDNARSRFGKLSDPNVKVVYLPPNITSLQPMDQSVIPTFKRYYLHRFIGEALAATSADKIMTIQDFWKRYNILDAVQNIHHVWNAIQQTTMNRTWQKLCPQFVPNSLIDVKDNKAQIDQEIVEMGLKLQSKMEVFDIEPFIESDSITLSNDDLIEMHDVLEMEGPGDINAAPRILKTKLIRDSLNQIDLALKALLENDPNLERGALVYEAVKRELTCYREMYQKKKSKTIAERSFKVVNQNFENHGAGPSSAT